jgi:hypothetical protein
MSDCQPSHIPPADKPVKGPRTLRLERDAAQRTAALELGWNELNSMKCSDLEEERLLLTQYTLLLQEVAEAIDSGNLDWAEDMVELIPTGFDIDEQAFLKKRLRETLKYESIPRLESAISMLDTRISEASPLGWVAPGEFVEYARIQDTRDEAISALGVGLRTNIAALVRQGRQNALELSRRLYERTETLRSAEECKALVAAADTADGESGVDRFTLATARRLLASGDTDRR